MYISFALAVAFAICTVIVIILWYHFRYGPHEFNELYAIIPLVLTCGSFVHGMYKWSKSFDEPEQVGNRERLLPEYIERVKRKINDMPGDYKNFVNPYDGENLQDKIKRELLPDLDDIEELSDLHKFVGDWKPRHPELFDPRPWNQTPYTPSKPSKLRHEMMPELNNMEDPSQMLDYADKWRRENNISD